MNVLHVITALDPRTGGPTSAMVALAAAQQRAGMNVAIVATYVTSAPEAVENLQQWGIRVEQIGPARGALRRHERIIPALRQLVPHFDIVHIHAIWEEIQHQAARTCIKLAVPYIFTPHGMLDPWSLRQGWLKKRLYLLMRLRRDLEGAAGIHYTSQGEREGAEALGLHPPAFVLPLGVDLKEFDTLPPPGRLRARYPQLHGRPLILYLGRLHPGKGLELLVPALARCGVDQAMLVAVGPDTEGYQAQVESLARQQGIAERVLFTGMLRGTERLEALVDADLLALPSFHENFGLVVVEALACGTPVIISDQVNIHHEIAQAGVGAVVPTDVAPLAEALRRWLTDDALRRSAAERARPFTRQTYDLERIARQWVDQYARIVEAHRAGAAPARA